MSSLATDLFDYPLPERLIAQVPSGRRDQSRLLVVDRQTRRLEHRVFADLPEFLRRDDLLIRNTAAVLPARLRAQRPTGGAVECLLLRPELSAETESWWCLVRPGRRLPLGATFGVTGVFVGTVQAKEPDGTTLVRFSTSGDRSIVELANERGAMPLPPYIQRDDAEDIDRQRDLERYQTVYADRARPVAVAAPTAGLHFTPDLLERLRAAGVQTADILLHVGLGTFRPIATPTIDEHAMHRETYELAPATQAALLSPPGRRIAVGTTSVRAAEDFLARGQAASASTFLTDTAIFIRPPATFRGVEGLITNFHQPRSTLLCLVAAFLTPGSTDGIAWLKEIYAEAVRREYRFFSYGDAMLVL